MEAATCSSPSPTSFYRGHSCVACSPSSTGHVVGAEWATPNGISVFAEYNDVSFNTKPYDVADTTGTVTTTYSAKTSANLAKLGVNHHV